MTNKLEILPNEIFLNIFLYFSWDEVLISFYSLNKRINDLICSIFEINKNGIIFNKPGLSYEKFSKILLPLMSNSLSLCSSIKYIHFDGINSIYINLIYQDIFPYNDKSILRFPNLKSLYITRCLLSQSLIQTLSFLIQYQLNELTLTFDEDFYEKSTGYESCHSNREKIISMLKQMLCQIFSNQCQLTSLQLDITKLSYEIHQCLNSHFHLSTNKISNDIQSYCITLHRLYIHLDHICFLEHLIEYVPNLEQLSVHFRNSLINKNDLDSNINLPKLSNENWFNKVLRLKCFTLKTILYTDTEFIYLKWLLNNLNHITKLQIHLDGIYTWEADQLIWQSLIDANFIRQYCLPSKIINLKYFYFYIGAKRQSSLNNISEIINSFKINSFFVEHQWTNVECFYDENRSYQHLFSSNLKKFQRSIVLLKKSYTYEWSDMESIENSFHPSFYLFLKQFDELCPNVSSMAIDIGTSWIKREIVKSLPTSFDMGQLNLNSSQFRHVTKLKFGSCSGRRIRPYLELTRDQDKECIKILSLLLSIPVQLKYIFVQKFEWLFFVIEYDDDYLEKDALDNVRYAEFGISSCNIGPDSSVHIGNQLVRFLSTYMPHLQTLRLWRPDDFPWSSIRPIFESEKLYRSLLAQWRLTLCTPESINEHVIVFEKDLCELVEQLKEFVYLDIYGRIAYDKVEPYHLMVQKRFPNSRIYIQISRFSLWI